MTTLHDFSAPTLAGTEKSLADYAGQVVLVVNTASDCGLAPQFTGLEALHQEFADRGLAVIGFPSDQFKQERDTAEEIESVCRRNYGVTFEMFGKVRVNGSSAHPVWSWLQQQKKGVLGGAIKWNFTKFLVDREGRVIARYAPTVKPEEIR
ncbi:MAG: glutathione peroxidase, partial [Actinobacteria bacterium]|nr:glutathione peroxidase [Actinomycetota bacterium]